MLGELDVAARRLVGNSISEEVAKDIIKCYQGNCLLELGRVLEQKPDLVEAATLLVGEDHAKDYIRWIVR